MTDPIGTAQERELIERLTYLVQFYVYAEAEQKDVQDIIEGLAERDSFTASDGWIIVKADEYDALQSRIAEVGELRQIIAALGYCTPDASLEFMRLIPAEVEAKCAALSLHRRPT
jgi:hypothetical protein